MRSEECELRSENGMKASKVELANKSLGKKWR
jgi:hypothetical protein